MLKHKALHSRDYKDFMWQEKEKDDLQVLRIVKI